MSTITDEIRAKATEYYKGHDVCVPQARRLLKEVGLPNGLLPLQEVEECGYVEDGGKTGFVWLKQKKQFEHYFKDIKKLVRYAPLVTAYVEPCKMKKVTGVKAKEFLWVTISEITIASPESEKIIFRNPTGITKTLPTSAFRIEEPEAKEEVKEGDSATAVNGKEAVAKENKEGGADAIGADNEVEAVAKEKKEEADAATATANGGEVANSVKEV